MKIGVQRIEVDHLVLGSGVAGLSTALNFAQQGQSVAIVTRQEANACATRLAQGGIACVTDPSDTFEEHVKDTLDAGDHLCDENVVRKIVETGPTVIKKLIELGAKFTTRGEMGDSTHQSEYDLGREGGHHKRRILHAGDITGEEVERVLLNACQNHPNITIYENYAAIDLITSWRLGWMGENVALGAYVLDVQNRKIVTFLALSTTIATGGAGKVYLYTSNPGTSCGAGIAMCYRAHIPIRNMEFFQFHPTILHNPQITSFLISEAVRGEGAVLKRRDNQGNMIPFMQNYHPMKDLAPRDVVARAIDQELKTSGQNCVYLDITHHSLEFLTRRFPNISAKCMSCGIDMSKNLIPVVPAAHYCCGGVKTDVNGFTGVTGLHVVGEAGSTGLHGANRLASNSLLEALVVAKFTVDTLMSKRDMLIKNRPTGNIPDWTCGNATDSDELVVLSHNWDEIRRFMWDYVGIVRTEKRLQRAKARIENIRNEIEKYYWDFLITPDLIQLRNLATVSEIIIDSALQRKESRGLHYNEDYPARNPNMDGVDSIVVKPLER